MCAADRIEIWAALTFIQSKAPVHELSPDTMYPEKQLNEIIAKYHPDTAALRRYMIEFGILERDGASVYWVSVNS
jgi:hypothetical protein